MRRLFRRSVPDDVAAELDFHLAMRAHELTERGVAPDDARRLAIARFPNLNQIATECRQIGSETERTMRRTEYLDEFLQDARFALRQLRKSAGFTVMAVATLALGIAGATIIFGAVDAVLLRRFAYAHPDRTMLVTELIMGDQDSGVSAGNYVDWLAANRSFTELGAEQFASFNLSTSDTPERVAGATVSASYFRVFGVTPEHGRVFGDQEDQPGSDQVVVLSDALWRRSFGADPLVVGRTVSIDGHPRTVLGIMPPSFDPLANAEQLWVPLAFTPERRAMHDEHYLGVFGLLKPGVTQAQARQDMDRVARDLAVKYPVDDGEHGAHVQPLNTFVVGSYRTPLLLLLGAVGLVLLIACSNVANLLLARSAARGKEMAIRAAIGAGRGRIIRQLMTESLILAGLSAVCGVILTAVALPAMIAAAPAGIPRIETAHINVTVILFAVGVAVLSAVICGLVPALRLRRGDLQRTLREGGRSEKGGARDRTRTVLVAAEVALALTLLTGSALLIRSSIYLQHVDPGFQSAGVLTARVGLPEFPAADSGAQARLMAQRLVEDIAARPGILSASITTQAPVGPGGTSNGLVREGLPPEEPKNRVQSFLRMVTPEYFSTLHIVLRKGRLFTTDDRHDAPRVMIISDSLANALWPGQDPIGKRVRCCEGTKTDPAWKTVVGVVGNVRSSGPAQDIAPEFYIPIDQAPPAAWSWTGNTLTIAVRGSGPNALRLAPAIRNAVHAINPSMPVYRINVLRDDMNASVAVERFDASLLTALGVLGLLLSTIGIYGVIAYFVTLRTHEIGVRMALGATGGQVLSLLLWQGARPLLAGVAVGAGIALWATELLKSVLHGVSPRDPLAFALVIAVLTITGLVATIIPALRAARIDPSRTLQGE